MGEHKKHLIFWITADGDVDLTVVLQGVRDLYKWQIVSQQSILVKGVEFEFRIRKLPYQLLNRLF